MTVLLCLIAGGLLLVRWAFNRWVERDTLRMLEDFQKAFPGMCPICSYARYGRQIGVYDAWPPAPHQCPDANRAAQARKDSDGA